MTQIDYYFSVISPYAYLAGDRLTAIVQRHNAEVIYKPLDVLALFARTGGIAPKDRHSSRKEYRAQDLMRQAIKTGLKFTLQPSHWPVNQAPASFAFIAAQNAGGGDLGNLAHCMTRACWAEERNIAEVAVIRECLAGAGFDPTWQRLGCCQAPRSMRQILNRRLRRAPLGHRFIF